MAILMERGVMAILMEIGELAVLMESWNMPQLRKVVTFVY
jgi:hypothetical protein